MRPTIGSGRSNLASKKSRARLHSIRRTVGLDLAAFRAQASPEGGYAADLTDQEIEQVGRDPLLIVYALSEPADRWV